MGAPITTHQLILVYPPGYSRIWIFHQTKPGLVWSDERSSTAMHNPEMSVGFYTSTVGFNDSTGTSHRHMLG